MGRNKPQKKINPQQVADNVVKDQLQTAGENFTEIFSRLDAVRTARSEALDLTGVTVTTAGTLIAPPQLQCSLSVTGKKPVMVGLSASLAPFGASAQTSGGFFIDTGNAGNIGVLTVFYLLANQISFWGAPIGISGPPLVTPGHRYQYFGSPSQINALHFPTVPGIVQYSLQLDNFYSNQTTQLTGVYLFATELF